MEKPFSYPVYQQARRLYQQSKISNFRVNNNIVDATVLDGNANQVKLVFNMSGQLTSKKCDCSYSKFYHECKHMAAVYMKVKDDNALTQGPVKLRQLYDVYVGNSPRPLEKNYSDFEFKLKQALNKFRLNAQIDNVFSYCLEFSNLIYPNHRRELIVMYIQDVLNDLRKNYPVKINDWMKQCLIDDKNDYLHDFFLRVFQSDNQEVLTELLENEKIQCNTELLTKLILIVYKNSGLSIQDFINHYFYLNGEAIFYLSTKDLCDKNEYEKVLKLYNQFNQKYPYSPLKKDMHQLYQKALLGNNPEKYVDRYIEKLNYWTKDFSDLSAVKKIVGDEWINIRYDAYKKIQKNVQDHAFKRIIHEQNEWEVALGYIYENPSYENIYTYLDLVIKNDEYLGYSAYFEYVISIAKSSLMYNSTEYVIKLLLNFYNKYDNQEALDHMIYHLRNMFKDNSELMNALDEMEGKYND